MKLLKALLFAMASITALNTSAQQWPDKTVRIVIPSPPGGSPDRVTRVIADQLSKMWKQAVVVENKPGASTRLAAEYVADAPADGYTLLSTFGTHTMVKTLFPDTKYDPIASFAAITPFVGTEVVYVVNADSPYKTLKELTDAYKKSGQPLPYAHFGTGSSFHLHGLMLGRHAGIQMLPVPYKGEAPQLNDVLGKQIESSFNSVGTAAPHVKAGKIRALATIAPTRSTVLPDVPTFEELGYTGMNSGGWFGLLAPSKVDKKIIDKISADVGTILRDPAIAQSFQQQGMQPMPLTSETFQRQMTMEVPKWRDLIQEFNVKPQ